MYESIRGRLIRAGLEMAVIETMGGIAYQIQIPPGLALPPAGRELLLYTSFVVREQSQTLYGFSALSQRDLFELLIAISGIGPKIALSLIGHTTISELQHSIQRDDTGPLCRVPGIGKKSASRILVEMRDKLPKLFAGMPTSERPPSSPADDAIAALIHLGYTKAAAQQSVEKALAQIEEDEIELASLITLSLKQ